MNNSIIIKKIGTYKPSNFISINKFIEHFKQQDKDVVGLYKSLGRTGIYRSNNSKENSLTMAIDSAKKVLNGINKDEIDMILFLSETPQYTVPCTALKISNALSTKNAYIIMDVNQNCSGMVSILELAKDIMLQKHLRKALIIGSLFYKMIANSSDIVAYGTISDASATLLLENLEQENIGIIDSEFYANSKNHAFAEFPPCGMSKVFLDNPIKEEIKQKWQPHDTSFFAYDWKELINKILQRNNLRYNQIKQYFFSQFSVKDMNNTLELLKLDSKYATIVSDKIGYTGCTSPFFACKQYIDTNNVQKDDYFIFCSVSIGYSMSIVLYKV